MSKKVWMVIGVLFGLLAVPFLMFKGTYNKLAVADEGVKGAWAQVENVYQRRLDLIPNLVNTVKGSAAHERETLQGVVEARSKVSQMTITPEIVNNPQLLQQFQSSQSQLSSALSRLMVVVERYPTLKANESFLALQSQIEGTENRITVERKRFNDASQAFNTLRRVFPNVLIANRMGFQEKAYFKAEATATNAPQVQF